MLLSVVVLHRTTILLYLLMNCIVGIDDTITARHKEWLLKQSLLEYYSNQIPSFISFLHQNKLNRMTTGIRNTHSHTRHDDRFLEFVGMAVKVNR